MKKLGILSLVFFALGGCTKHAFQQADPPTKLYFGTTVPDSVINLTQAVDPLKPTLPFLHGGEYDLATSEWLDLSRQIMETADILETPDRERLYRMGGRLAQTLHGFSNSQTMMTANSVPAANPYTELVYGYAEPLLLNMYVGAIDTVEGEVTTASLGLGVTPYNENTVAHVLLSDLGEFKERLKKGDPNTAEFRANISQELDKQYIQGLEEIDQALQEPNPKSFTFLKLLKHAIKKFTGLEPSEIQKLNQKVDDALTLSVRVNQITTSDSALKVLVDLWIAADERKRMPKSLTDAFHPLDDEKLFAMVTENQNTLIADPHAWEILKARTDFRHLSSRELIARAIDNKSRLLSDPDWDQDRRYFTKNIQPLLSNPDVVEYLKTSGENISAWNDIDRMTFLVNRWMDLATRLSFPDQLRQAFNSFDEDSLLAIRNTTTAGLAASGKPTLAYARYQLLTGIENFQGSRVPNTAENGIANFVSYMDYQIVTAAKDMLFDELGPFVQSVQTKLVSAIVPALEEKKKTASEFVNRLYLHYARYYLGKNIFGVPDLVKELGDPESEKAEIAKVSAYSLPVLEKAELRLIESAGQLQDLPSPDVTSSEVLGLSLSVMPYHLSELQTYQSVKPSAREFLSVVFEGVVKLGALVGYKGYDLNTIVAGLTVPMTPGHSGEKLDIFDYDPTKVIFASPDKIVLRDRFRIDPGSEVGARISVQGQMELLDGVASSLKFLRPWRKNSFDDGIGQIALEENGDSIFPKESLYKIALGNASIVLKNLQVRSLMLLTSDDQWVDISTVGDINQIDVTGAAVTDYDIQGNDQKVSTSAMARSIIALTRIYLELEELIANKEHITDPMILDNFGEIKKAAALTKKLIAGLSIFSTNYLMMKDGGFAHSFSIQKNSVGNEPRVLADQLLMQQAMIEAGNALDTDVIRLRAIDNLFFLNSRFWNPKLGFYSADEPRGLSGRARLLDVARAVRNAQLILPVLEDLLTHSPELKKSYDQLSQLESLWLTRFFSEDVVHLNGVEQVLDFSL